MGKKKQILKLAWLLLFTDDYEVFATLGKILESRRFHRDVVALLDLLDTSTAKKGSLSPGAFHLLLLIGKIATETDAPAIASLLQRHEIYLEPERSFRGLLLTILGLIGTPATKIEIENAAPLFEQIKYEERAVGCCRGSGRHIVTPENLMAADRRDIAAAIKAIDSRKQNDNPQFFRGFYIIWMLQ